MLHFTDTSSSQGERVEDMREGGKGKGEPSCDWRLSVAVNDTLAKHDGGTLRVALL